MEIDLLRNYPKAKRDLSARLESKSEEVRNIARLMAKIFLMAIENAGMAALIITPASGRTSFQILLIIGISMTIIQF